MKWTEHELLIIRTEEGEDGLAAFMVGAKNACKSLVSLIKGCGLEKLDVGGV